MFTSRARATKASLAFAAPLSIAEACATMAKAGGTAGAERGGHGKVELCRPAAQFDHTDAHSCGRGRHPFRSEEHTSELQSLMRISYAVFCLKQTKKHSPHIHIKQQQYKITEK